MKTLLLCSAFVFSVAAGAQQKSPVIIGDPSKGTPITTVVDGNKKVHITTSGISVEGDDDEVLGTGDTGTDTAAGATTGKSNRVIVKSTIGELEDIIVPIAFFLFLLAAILGGKYFTSRNEEKRLQLIRMMVEKGQPVPEAVITQILSPQAAPEADTARQAYKRTRNAYGFTIAGLMLIAYALIRQDLGNTAVLVPGLIFICLGFGGLAGLYLPKQREEKIVK